MKGGLIEKIVGEEFFEHLPGLGFVAKPRRNIGYRSDGGIIETSLKANGAERGKSVRNPNAKPNFMSISQSMRQSPCPFQVPFARPAERDSVQERGH